MALLRDAGHAGADTMFHSISLLEPAKEAVYAWRAGQPIPRAAAVVLRDRGKTYEARVDLDARKVTSFEAVTGGQPMIALPEILGAQGIALADQRMQDGLRKRGVTDFSQLFCAPRTAGNFGHAHEREHRIVKVDCFDTRGVTTDVFATPDRRTVRDGRSRFTLGARGDRRRRGADSARRAGLRSRHSRPGARRQAGGAVVAARIERRDRRLVHPLAELVVSPALGPARRDRDLARDLRRPRHSRARCSTRARSPRSSCRTRTPPWAGTSATTWTRASTVWARTASPLAHGVDCPANAAYLPVSMSNAAGGTDTHGGPRVRVRARAGSSGVAALRHRDPGAREPAGHRAGGALDRDRRQLRLRVRLGVRPRRLRSPSAAAPPASTA